MPKKPYISVLERNMSNPEYRKQMEEQQALERVYPEAILAGVRLPKRPDVQVPKVKIGEKVSEYDHPAWKNVSVPSPKESLDRLRKEEAASAKHLMMRALEESGKDANKRLYREAGSQEMLSPEENSAYKKGGKVTASKRGDGIAKRGKTRGRMV